MLSFDVSAIDVVLLVVMLVLLLLFIAQRRSQSMAESQLSINLHETPLKEPKVRREIPIECRLSRQSEDGFRGCAHQFGRLGNMSKNSHVPDECFGCPNILRCMFKS